MNFGSPEGPLSQIHSPHIHAHASGIFSDLLRPEFAVEDLPLDRTATLVPMFAVKHSDDIYIQYE